MKNNKYKLAFSLIEITVVLVILSIALSLTIVGASKVLEVKREQRAEKHIDEVKEKIERYRVANGRYPCPARLDLAVDDAGFGLEATRTQGGGATGTACYRDTNAAGTYFPNSIAGTFRSGTKINNSVLVGAVPVQALGIDRKYATDAWGNKIIYAVTEKLAVDANNRTAADAGDNLVSTAGPDNTNGNIIVNDALTGNAIAARANYVVVAPGPDANGAFNANATVQSACEATGVGVRERENCVLTNNIFVTSGAMNKVEGDDYFYDIVRWDSFSSNDVQISGSAGINSALNIQGTNLPTGTSALNVVSGGANISGDSTFQGGTTTRVDNALDSRGGATFDGGGGTNVNNALRANTTLNVTGVSTLSGTNIGGALNSTGGATFDGGSGTEIKNPLTSTSGATFSGLTGTKIDNDLTVTGDALFSGSKTDIRQADVKLVDQTNSATCNSSNVGRLRFNNRTQHTETCIQSGASYIWKPVQDGLPCPPSDPACKGPSGEKGDKGDPCLPSDPACKGPKGDKGLDGSSKKTATLSFINSSTNSAYKCVYLPKKYSADDIDYASYGYYQKKYSAPSTVYSVVVIDNPFPSEDVCTIGTSPGNDTDSRCIPGSMKKAQVGDYYYKFSSGDAAYWACKVKCNDVFALYCYNYW